ncbi:hypothetical protein ACP3VS_23790 [Lysinibacillus sp. VIII_CA]|uniref:hypothetical protein n=1 Tax=Lysinibacillus sp. VIII_CA TaxID=3417452 RepID=UPI003CF050FC
MKKICISLFGLFLFVTLGTGNTFASEGLTQEEEEILLNEVGLENEDLEILPLEQLRMFIAEDAEVVLEESEIVTFNEIPTFEEGRITTFGSISESKLKITGKAVKLSNNSSGQKRYNLYGTWKWITAPINTYVDGMSIGFESGLGILLPTSGGKISEHSHEYATYERGIKNLREHSVYPDDWAPGNGVAALYDIVQGGSGHSGYISQNVYMTNSTGSTNLKFEYAHARTIFNPSFSVSKGVFGVSVGKTIDTADFASTLNW